jgi:hypothetical protein
MFEWDALTQRFIYRRIRKAIAAERPASPAPPTRFIRITLKVELSTEPLLHEGASKMSK